jgi:hypothetical protein
MEKELKDKEKQYQLIINAKTWSKESHGLFDYESNNMSYKTITLKVLGDQHIYRRKNTTYSIDPKMKTTENYMEYLMSIKEVNSKIYKLNYISI